MLRSLAVLIGNELRMMARAKATLFWIFVFPFVILTMMMISYGGSGRLASINLDVADGDQSDASARYVKAIRSAFERLDGVQFETRDVAAMSAPVAGAVRLTVPPSFGELAGRGQDVAVSIYTPDGSLSNELALRVIRSATLRYNADLAGAPMIVSVTLAAESKQPVSFAQYMLTGVIVMSIMATAMSNLCVALADRRERNVFKLMACLPLSPSRYLAAMLLSRLLMVMIASTALLIGARLIFAIPVSLEPSRLMPALAVIVLGASALLALGSALSARMASVADAVFVSNMAYIVLLFLSDLTMPMSAMPASVRGVVGLLPTTEFVGLLRRVLIEGRALASQWSSLLVLLAWAIAFGALSRLRFRWHRR